MSDKELNQEVLDLAKKIEEGMVIDKSTGVGAEKEDADLYKSNLPEGLTMDIVKEVSNYNTTFVAAGAYAFGKMAIDAMAGNKKLNLAEAEIKMGGRDKVAFSVQRQKEYQARLGQNAGETIVKMGVITPTLEIKAGNKNAGQLKIVRSQIGELAMKKLK